MEEQILDIPFHSQKKLNFAGFWIRLVALAIDLIILAGVNYMLALILFNDVLVVDISVGVQLIYILVSLCYFSGMESAASQATLGKMTLKIKAGNVRGEEITFASALDRNVCEILSALIFFVGFMMAGWEPRKQALHDKLASTYVFHT